MSTPIRSYFGNGRRWRSAVVSLVMVLAGGVAFAQEEPTRPKGSSTSSSSPAAASSAATGSNTTAVGQPSEADMMRMMMENSKLNENHKLLGQLAGNWNFVTKMWMAPDAPPSESKGTAVRKSVMDGRYYSMDVSGRIPMPGPDGKMKEMDFKGMSLEAYDNAKQKFVSTWSDNMSTGIMLSEGTYDPATKTFTYTADYAMAPGMTSKVRETVKIVDNDHHNFEFFEDRGGQEVKTMEIAYTRKK